MRNMKNIQSVIYFIRISLVAFSTTNNISCHGWSTSHGSLKSTSYINWSRNSLSTELLLWDSTKSHSWGSESWHLHRSLLWDSLNSNSWLGYWSGRLLWVSDSWVSKSALSQRLSWVLWAWNRLWGSNTSRLNGGNNTWTCSNNLSMRYMSFSSS